MKSSLRWRVLLTLGVTALAIFLAYPPSRKIKLGLDLKGGIHLVLQVMTEDAVNAETDQEISRFQEVFKRESITFTSATKEKPGHFYFAGLALDQEGKAKDTVDKYTQDWDYSFVGDRMDFTLKPTANVISSERGDRLHPNSVAHWKAVESRGSPDDRPRRAGPHHRPARRRPGDHLDR